MQETLIRKKKTTGEKKKQLEMIKSEVIIKSEKILEYIQMTLLRRRDVSDISTWYSTVL